jgi:hypothetical protein
MKPMLVCMPEHEWMDLGEAVILSDEPLAGIFAQTLPQEVTRLAQEGWYPPSMSQSVSDKDTFAGAKTAPNNSSFNCIHLDSDSIYKLLGDQFTMHSADLLHEQIIILITDNLSWLARLTLSTGGCSMRK